MAPPTTTTTTAVPTPSCTTVPAVPPAATSTTIPAPAAQAPAVAPAPAPESPTPAPEPAPALADAPTPAEPSAVEPVEPENDDLSSKTAEPDPDWAPTEDPNATVVPGEMRSDREEIPAPFTKEDADKAETMEARQRMSRAAAGCQTYWPSPYEVCGVIRDKYNSLGGPGSFLSFPNSPEYTNPDGYGKRTQFLNGPIYWSAATGAHPVVNSFLNRWGVHRYEAGFLRYPTTDEIVHSNGVGRHQEFQGGAIYVAFQNAVGSAIGGVIRDKWNSAGGYAGPLGYPSSDELPVNKNNGRYNNFVNGTITWSQPTGARLLFGAVRDVWARDGREDGHFGYPLSDELVSSDGIGHWVRFESGDYIYSTVVTGAWRVPWKVFQIWEHLGNELGALGYPTALPRFSPAPGIDLRQLFQRGEVTIGSDGYAYYRHY
ncbi:hypothetical protein CH275_09880 [Rhodococcus sp. 06-235-1A]|nr:hypothetical protein CH275_09880 [Rhodococcus sp. 06-235-1A]